MAEWIKVRSDILEMPQFAILCAALNCDRGDALMCLVRIAAWFETHSEYELMAAEDAALADIIVCRPGVCAALREIGWLREDGRMVRLSGFCAPSAARKSIGAKLRADVLAAGSCVICGATGDLVVEHATPVVRGGKSDRANLQCMCADCNRAKGCLTMSEFLASLEKAA